MCIRDRSNEALKQIGELRYDSEMKEDGITEILKFGIAFSEMCIRDRNPTGVRAGGSQGGDCTKLRPTVTIHAGETVTLVDAAGPGPHRSCLCWPASAWWWPPWS